MTPLSRLDHNLIPDLDEIRLFAKVRNEAKRLPFFLCYYRALGVDRFFIIDNDFKGNIKAGKLGDLAPTILTMMNIQIPKEMNGEVLIDK